MRLHYLHTDLKMFGVGRCQNLVSLLNKVVLEIILEQNQILLYVS